MFEHIGYLNVKVTREEIEEAKAVSRNQHDPNSKLAEMADKYLRELAKLQREGVHAFYLQEESQITCTCGLTLFSKNAEFEGDKFSIEFLDPESLDQESKLPSKHIANVKGHRRLPRGKDETVAIIYDRFWDNSARDFLHHAYCQGCRENLTEVIGKEARDFVRIHNKSCTSPQTKN